MLALRTDALEKIIGRGDGETVGGINLWQWGVGQTESAPTALTVEMHVQVVIIVVIVAMAEFVAYAIAAILDDVYQMMFTKKSQCTEYARLVN